MVLCYVRDGDYGCVVVCNVLCSGGALCLGCVVWVETCE